MLRIPQATKTSVNARQRAQPEQVWAMRWALGRPVVKYWGRNDDGQLCDGNTDSYGDGPSEMGDALPAIDLGGVATSIAVGSHGSACALLSNGAVKYWGANRSGELGFEPSASNPSYGNNSGETSPPSVDFAGQTTTLLVLGYEVSCALAAGAVRCLGEPRHQRGPGHPGS